MCGNDEYLGGRMQTDTLTAEEAAQLLKISVSLVRSWAKVGEIPCRRVGRVLRFSRVALEEWLRTGGQSDGEGNTQGVRPCVVRPIPRRDDREEVISQFQDDRQSGSRKPGPAVHERPGSVQRLAAVVAEVRRHSTSPDEPSE